MNKYYDNIISIIKGINEKTDYVVNERINFADKRFNEDINIIDRIQEKEIEKRIERLQIYMFNLKEVMTKMETIRNDYYKIKKLIQIYKEDNLNMKNQLKYQNIPKNIIAHPESLV